MPRVKHKRRRPVTAAAKPAPASVPLPPIHVHGQEKITIQAPTSATLGKLGKSSADTRRRINHFHTLIKQYSKLAALGDRTDEVQQQIDAVTKEMAEMGGLDWYQKASLLGQSKGRGGDTSRWLVPKLKELKLAGPLRLLDVGALSSLNYFKERRWISVTPIDLNSQEPGIFQQDFLDIDPGRMTGENAHLFKEPFDIVCLSLVVNFIGDPAKRGEMLQNVSRLLHPQGLFFLVLPLACVNNSRYFDDDRLLQIMQSLGFSQLFVHHTAKLAHYLYRFTGETAPTEFKKKLLHSTPNRNNFSITL